jgi:uncharacterized surface protein with fasciclin (FAS1) repeats
MKTSLHRTRPILIGMCLLTGAGLAGLPLTSEANRCMMKKPYGQMGPMHSYMPRHYAPMHHHHYTYDQQHHAMNKPAGKHRDYGMQQQADTPAPATKAEVASAADSGPDIIETAAAAQNFRTLIRAAEAAGLYDTLRGDGPFTVFAPSDAAFAKLPEGTLGQLLADKDKLAAVLGYHVVPERLTAADLLQRREFTTVQGQTLSLESLTVATADIEASNGIIHVIDAVLMPKP